MYPSTKANSILP